MYDYYRLPIPIEHAGLTAGEMAQNGEEPAPEEKTLEERRKLDRLAFLKNYASLKNVPGNVDISRIKKIVDMPTRFIISFWAAKAKVCKPYSS